MRFPTLKPPQEWNRRTENTPPLISKCSKDEAEITTREATVQAAMPVVAMPVICVAVLCVPIAAVSQWVATVSDAFNRE